jgi:hypothetical protein
MERAQYFVIRFDTEWKIKFEGQLYGPYSSRQEAIRVAVESAYASGENGNEAEVLVQGSNYKFHTEWAYGRDPYPPPEER